MAFDVYLVLLCQGTIGFAITAFVTNTWQKERYRFASDKAILERVEWYSDNYGFFQTGVSMFRSPSPASLSAWNCSWLSR